MAFENESFVGNQSMHHKHLHLWRIVEFAHFFFVFVLVLTVGNYMFQYTVISAGIMVSNASEIVYCI